MALFAIMKKHSAIKIYRIETDQKTDSKILLSFKDQQTHFEKEYHQALPFDAGYNPGPDECNIIKNFKESKDLIDAINRSTAYPKWDKSVGLEDIAALFMATDFPNNKNKISIQSFSKKQILSSSKYLWLNNNSFSLSDLLGFSLDDKIVAIIEGSAIKFRNFNNLRSIFDMKQYFIEATKQDLDDFILQNSFDVPQGFDLNQVADNVIRKKVTLINKSGILSTQPVSKIESAAMKLNFPLKTSGAGNNKKIIMPSTKKEIKDLLNFLDEDYFNSEITQTRYRSNSKRIA